MSVRRQDLDFTLDFLPENMVQLKCRLWVCTGAMYMMKEFWLTVLLRSLNLLAFEKFSFLLSSCEKKNPTLFLYIKFANKVI